MTEWLATMCAAAILAALVFSLSPGRRAAARGATTHVPSITEIRNHNEKPLVLTVKAIFTEENNDFDDKESPGISTVWNGSIESAPVKIVLLTHP